jgi:predicted ATP-binding protein involved in virulence
MRILQFKAEKVYGYLNFNIKFDEKLSFLVGGNGSGKTTVLKLIQALLTPNLKDIYLVPFKMITLSIKVGEFEHVINASKSDEGIKIAINNINNPLELPNKDIDELSYILSKEENLFNRELFHHRENEVFKFIQNLDVPLFLGLERRESNKDDDENYYRHEHIISRSGERRVVRKNRYIDGSLGVSLLETQDIIRNTYAKIRKIIDAQRTKLRDDILLTSFHFSDINDLLDENGEFKKMSLEEQKNITSKKEDIFKALKNIDFNKEKNLKEVAEFFNNIEELFSQMTENQEEKGINIAWLINKAQIERIQKLIELIDSNNVKVEKIYKNISKFINTINHFFNDTGKSIEIDNIGNLRVKKPNDTYANLEALSSGERQLIVMFSHLIFKNESNPSGVFIIDEPELSLHIDWQKDFIKFAIEANPDTQLILATHSPDIFIGNEKKTILIKRS